MKKVGLVILIVGILISILNGLNYVSNEIVLDSGRLSIDSDESQVLTWSPLSGVLIFILGGLIFIAGIKRKTVSTESQNN